LRIAKVDQQPIPQVLGNMPLIAGDDLRTGPLVRPHHVPQVFRIELAGQARRLHQVTKQHRELAPFGVWWGGGNRWRWGLLGDRLRCGRRRGRWRGSRGHLTGPDPDPAGVIHGQPARLHEVFLPILDIVVIQAKLPLERPIRRPALPLEKRNDLSEHVIEVHHRPSTCASAASVWGSQKVISIDWYSSIAVASAADKNFKRYFAPAART